jgi:glycosyltransferase involved in cell wall biosynthesis
LKVLFQTRTTLFLVPGGDTTQVERTADALTRQGCSVDISLELAPALADYDVVHLFNLSRPQEIYVQALNARRAGKKVVLSTIHVNYDEFELRARTGVSGFIARSLPNSTREYLKVCARAAKNGEWHSGVFGLMRSGYRTLQEKTLEMVDLLLPNSLSEMSRVATDFASAKGLSYRVIPNGVDRILFGSPRGEAPSLTEYKDCVLCVARIEGLKNQLNLVRAARQLPWSFVLVGKAAPNHADYYRRVRAESPSNVVFVDRLAHEQLAPLYRSAKVHALASWMETTGLSSLEAGASGCNLVITDKGDQREYFGSDAFYCDPQSVDSIREALIRAYEAPSNHGLRERILSTFTWDIAASRTLEAYLSLT